MKFSIMEVKNLIKLEKIGNKYRYLHFSIAFNLESLCFP
jgi:hypothetical protein